jgi:hypothetical protein
MRPFKALVSLIVLIIPAVALAQKNPFIGSWAINPPGGFAGWLGVSEREGKLSAEIMWGFGSVVPVDSVTMDGDKLVLTRIQRFQETGADGRHVRRTATETITARLTGDNLALTTITRRDDGAGNPKLESFTGKRLPPIPPAPDLTKVRFGRPISLLNGKDITGWRLTDPNAANGWKIVDGVLVNDPVQTPGQPHKNYGNLRTDREFEDFRLTLEVNVPKGGNSGVYLRGVYEVQVEDSYGQPTDPHHMGAVYSRIKPTVAAEKPAGEWQTMDITLVDRHVTVILNGTKIIDNQPVPGPTGGALWSDPTRPGPIYLQGDHLAVSYRNMVLRPVVGRR